MVQRSNYISEDAVSSTYNIKAKRGSDNYHSSCVVPGSIWCIVSDCELLRKGKARGQALSPSSTTQDYVWMWQCSVDNF